MSDLACPSGSGSQASPEAPSDLRPSGVDPSRTPDPGTQGKPVAWAYEVFLGEFWLLCTSPYEPEVTRSIRNIRPLYEALHLGTQDESVATKGSFSALSEIAAVIRYWLKYDTESRSKEGIETIDDTALIAPPFWPTHGMFRAWIEALDAPTAPQSCNVVTAEDIDKLSEEISDAMYAAGILFAHPAHRSLKKLQEIALDAAGERADV